jgi:hypothetical protein
MIMKMLFGLSIWFAIFCFITGTYHPMEWSTTAKIFAVIIGIAVINHSLEE